MKIREVNEMKVKGFENYEPEVLLDAYTITNATKTTLANLEKEVKSALEEKLNVGDQLSLDFGANTFSANMVELDDISFDCSEDDILSYCIKEGLSSFFKQSLNGTAIKKAYRDGTLNPDLVSHIVVNKQQEMKITKKARKEEK